MHLARVVKWLGESGRAGVRAFVAITLTGVSASGDTSDSQYAVVFSESVDAAAPVRFNLRIETRAPRASRRDSIAFVCRRDGEVALTVAPAVALPTIEEGRVVHALISYSFSRATGIVPPVEEAINMEMNGAEGWLLAIGQAAQLVLDRAIRSDLMAVEVFGVPSTRTHFNVARARSLLAEFDDRCEALRATTSGGNSSP